MKKLILSAAIVLGSFSTFATTLPSSTTTIKNVSILQDEYKEIKADEVPDAVKTALKTAYPDAVIEKAYTNEKKEYKLDIAVGDQKATVYADATGNWIKK